MPASKSNLSLEQAPPISVPFRFFLTAPIFGLLAALLLMVYGPDAMTNRWAPVTLALTHLITLGFLGLIMCGAMMQMLPVLAGSPVPKVQLVATWTHILLTTGTLALALGFLTGEQGLFHLALATLGLGFLIFITAVSIALIRIKTPNATIHGMRLAVASLLVTVILGLTVGAGFSGMVPVSQLIVLTDIHLGWGLLGWIGLLMVSVAYQVVPMFQLTPEYPGKVTKPLSKILFTALILWGLLYLAWGSGHLHRTIVDTWMLIPAIGYLLFAVITLRLQMQRRRRIPDITLAFWRTGMITIGACLLLWLIGFIPAASSQMNYPLLLGVWLLFGVAVSVVSGMLYKIIPFLAWFHLQSRQVALMSMGKVKVPNMKELIPDRLSRQQLHAHLATLLLLTLAALWPNPMARVAGLSLGISCTLLLTNMILAGHLYQKIDQELSDFEASG
ncbi:Putative transmembrane protein [hydrothermal vent metagenome]|uniref:Transmembrane protein n=1 Tax=hydrothermal vent metagenome TaxID=652676 RepID=A0A3B1B262_9ZZZZ